MSEYDAPGQPPPNAAERVAQARPSWLAALPRLWLLRPISTAPGGGAIQATVIVGVACLVFWVVIDHWESQPDPQFFADGIPLFPWFGLAIVGLTAVLRWRSQARIASRRAPSDASGATTDFTPLLALTMGLAAVLFVYFTLGAAFLDPAWFLGASVIVCIYAFLYLARSLRCVTGESQRAAAWAGLAFIAAFVWITDRLNVIPDVWSPAQTQETVASDASDEGEAILFAQSALIDHALAAIKVDGTAPPRAFFIGFAGVGDQKVFAQEIGLASRVLDEKYAIDIRTLSLVNDERDLRRRPLATVSGLKYALQGLASRMNLDRDVLFLAISSHGSDGPDIAVSNSQLPLKDLSNEDLAHALRDSGIKWRVIIISACYAGAFINSLRDPQTIVITAAAADRTSFGCSNDSDLTYFGEAFYRDALPTAHTLREAFDHAKTAIASRERMEHITASNPQAYFGKRLEEKLAGFDSR